MVHISVLLLLIGNVVTSPTSNNDGGSTRKCGYESCTSALPEKLNVHIVPHTHNDLGWVKTVEEYYYGTKNYDRGVKFIIDSVVKALWADEKRRFVYAEIAFFWQWWTEQTTSIQDMVKILVQEGRLQFVGGGWSMNDEAGSHYQSIIDQFTLGLRKLNDTFGECATPHVGWQIDPFGHSREFASIVAAMGYDGLFLGRIDYQDKNNRLSKQNMEMVWRTNDDLGKYSDIFTGVLYNIYAPPRGFCFDIIWCHDDPIFDDKQLPVYNLEKRVADFIAIVEKMAKDYNNNNILITMGDDFHYLIANQWFQNLDKLIRHVNAKSEQDNLKINLFYSTPACYLKAVRDANPTLPTKGDDFFPYASDSHSYWTGYFTSRPTTKYFEREGNGYLQMAKQLHVVADLPYSFQIVLEELKYAMGVLQHHDAITGTEKQYVAFDYDRMLDQAVEDVMVIPRLGINKLTGRTDSAGLSITRCRLNESSCEISETSDKFIVTLYNPLAWKIEATPVRIPVKGDFYAVIAPNGEEIDSQIVKISDHVLSIPTRESNATHELIFIALNLKPLGYKSFYVQKTNKARNKRQMTEKRKKNFDTNINEYWENIERKDTQVKNIEDINGKMKIPSPQNPNTEKRLRFKSRRNLDVHTDKDLPNFTVARELNNNITHSTLQLNSNQGFGGLNPNDIEKGMLSEQVNNSIVDKFDDVLLENEQIKLKINNTFGQTNNHPNDNESPFSIELLYYPSWNGDNTEAQFRSSGAYIFRPQSTEAISINKDFNSTVIKGKVVDEVAYKFTEYASGSVRIYKDSALNYIEHDWVIGPIPVEDNIGKEFIVRYGSHIKNNGEFYTDSNGRQDLKRRLNYRPQWDLEVNEPIAGNYYPVTNKIYIQDSGSRLTVLTDRSEGGSSLQEGNIELMLHRRLLRDDMFGVNEALNETRKGKGLMVKGKHRLLFSPVDDVNKIIDDKKKTLEMHLQPIVMLSEASDIDLERWLALKNCDGAVKEELPIGLHLLTLEPWNNNQILLRFENYMEKSDKKTGTDLEIDLNKLFTDIRIVSIRETTLAANRWLDSTERWEWNTEYNKYSCARDAGIDLVIKISAKEIRTFVADYFFGD